MPMYDFAEIVGETDAFWTAMAARLNAAGLDGVPESLTRSTNTTAIWRDPALLFAQCCGYPLVTLLAGQVRVVATPCYAAEGCEGPLGRSAFVVRATDRAHILADLRGRRCAINARDSNSGMNVLRASLAPLAGGQAFFTAVLETGAHAQSARAVADGMADLAAIDCVTWALLQSHQPGLTRGLRVLAWSALSPWLPFITARLTPDTDREALWQALRPDHALLIDSYARLTISDYQCIKVQEAAAASAGFAILC